MNYFDLAAALQVITWADLTLISSLDKNICTRIGSITCTCSRFNGDSSNDQTARPSFEVMHCFHILPKEECGQEIASTAGQVASCSFEV